MNLFRTLPAKMVLCAIVMLLLGGAGGYATASSIDTWYATLNHPPGKPPNWIFGPVWSTLYFLIGISFAVVWHDHPIQLGKTRLTYLFITQLLLNLSWTPVFFGAHQINAALLVILALWISIILTIREFARFSKLAAYLLIPYFLWVTYATYLNVGYSSLN